MYVGKSVVWGQIFEIQILMDLHVLKTPEITKKSYFLLLACVCMCVYLCMRRLPE